MSWLARLKTGKTPEKDASKTTETLFVVSVAPTSAPLQKNEGVTVAANDPAPVPVPMPVTATGDIRAVHPPGIAPGFDPDAYCWPHSTATSGKEIDLLAARLHRFTDKGLTVTEGEALADKLVIRDREADDRRFCLECRHLSGNGHSSWRCGNWQAAGVAIRLRDSQLPAGLVLQLQRCDGFTSHLTSTPQGKDDDHAHR